MVVVLIRFQRIAESRPRNELGWEQVRSIRSSNPEIEQMFQWLSHSLDNGQAEPFDDFRNAIPKMTTPVPL